MKSDLERQVRDYCDYLDERQSALSVEDVLARGGGPRVASTRGEDQPSSQPEAVKTPAIGLGRGLAWAAAAFVLIMSLGGLYLAFGGSPDQVVDQTTVPTPTTLLTTTPNPNTTSREVIHTWPGSRSNPAGLYSWTGYSCGHSCLMGFMHNGYGSGDVEIRIEVVEEIPTPADDATLVTIAGHEGTYRRLDDRHEEWIVDIERTTLAIRLTAEPGTSQADLDEAHAIIDSMWTEPRNNDFGFRLVFRLATDDWDSG